MRKISTNEIGEKLRNLLDEENPLEEDIGVFDNKGGLAGVIITKKAYKFFLRKVKEEEDRADRETIDEFHKQGKKNGK